MDKKRVMRHTNEIHAILTAIYCINETTSQDEGRKIDRIRLLPRI